MNENLTTKETLRAPKLQVSKGYRLDHLQNARLLAFIADQPKARRIAKKSLTEGTGLSNGQIASLVSIGGAIGLVAPRTQVLTPLGKLVAQHDLFFDSPATLEFCHFRGAGNPRNLIWFMVFNDLLSRQEPTDLAGWRKSLRAKLAGKYSRRSLVKHVGSEVRFLVDAYTVKKFKKLGLLTTSPNKTLLLGRSSVQPLTLAAMVYSAGKDYAARVIPFSDLYAAPGSPGKVFGLDAPIMRQLVENLDQKGWVRFEVRHGLDQVRLFDGFEPLQFLASAYKNQPPESAVAMSEPEAAGALV